jgi:non-specific serine/threonine protein kinase
LDAAQAYERALVHYRNAGAVTSLTVRALCGLGAIGAMLGDTERAVALCQECIAICEAHGEQWARSKALLHLAFVRWLQHDLPEASTNVREALRLKGALHDLPGIAWCVELLAWVVTAEDDPQHAAVLFGIGDRGWEQVGGRQRVDELCSQRKLQVRDALGKRAFDAAVTQGRRFALDEALGYALGEKTTASRGTAGGCATTPAALDLAQLTRREREVAALVAQGMSNKDIAAKLVIARRTAENHIQNILTKLGLTSRTQIAAWIIAAPQQ